MADSRRKGANFRKEKKNGKKIDTSEVMLE